MRVHTPRQSIRKLYYIDYAQKVKQSDIFLHFLTKTVILPASLEWLTDAALTPEIFKTACDANGDEVVNLLDLEVLSQNW